jgi:uncharacterized protein
METMERKGGVLLRDGRDCAYFIPSEMRLFSLDADPQISLEELFTIAMKEHPASRPAESEGYAPEEREALLPILRDGGPKTEAQKISRLGRLTLIISNVCSLSCSYCYIPGRNPLSNGRMSPDTVRDLLRRLIDFYPEIEVLHFFGGEPLMNLPAMEAAVEFLAAAVDEGFLHHLPHFAVTTNGTWSNPEVLDLLKRWNISVTVSCDGSRQIQDACRPLRSGAASSYELVAETMERFQEAGIEFDIECTYNGHHRKLGIAITDLMNFFYEKTGQRTIHIAPVFLPRPGSYEMGRSSDYIDFETLAADYRAAARLSVSNLIKGEGPVLEFVQRVVEHLASRIPAKTYCPAFFTQLTVDMKGSVYPCFMLAGHNEYNMGNLLQETFPGAASKRVLERYFEEFTSENLAWYSCLCQGCIAGEYLVTGNMRERVMAPMQRAIAEECVLGLARHLGSAKQVHSGKESREAKSVCVITKEK